MNAPHAPNPAKLVADGIAGYEYGSARQAESPISLEQFQLMKQSAGFTEEDERWLRVAGGILADQTKTLVQKWRSVIALQPHLASYSLGPHGEKLPQYSEASGLRFEQWILDTCLRPYDQAWLNYQQEIAMRHTSAKKNKTDHVESAPWIPLRYVIAFAAVIADPEIMRPFLSAKKHPAEDVEKMHRAWSKSVFLQIALWTQPYTNPKIAPNQW